LLQPGKNKTFSFHIYTAELCVCISQEKKNSKTFVKNVSELCEQGIFVIRDFTLSGVIRFDQI
jgi:hypothetical protein